MANGKKSLQLSHKVDSRLRCSWLYLWPHLLSKSKYWYWKKYSKTVYCPVKCQKFVGETPSITFHSSLCLASLWNAHALNLISPHVGLLLCATAQSGLTGASEHPFCMVSCVGSLRAVAEFWNAPLALLCSWTLCRGSTSTRRVWSSQTWWRSPSALRAPGWPQSRRVKKSLTPSYSWSCGSTMRKYRGNDSSWPSSCQSHKSLHRHCLAKAESFQIWEVTVHTAAQHRVALNTYRKKLLWIYLE